MSSSNLFTRRQFAASAVSIAAESLPSESVQSLDRYSWGMR